MSSIIQITKKLEEIENIRQKALSANFIGLWLWDVKSNTLKWDEGMYRIYDIDESEFSGTYDDWKNRLYPDDFDLTEKNLKACLHDETDQIRYFYRFRIKHKGKWRWVSGIGNKIKDDNDEPIAMAGVNILEPDIEESGIADPRDFSVYKDSIDSAIFPTVLSSPFGELIYANKSYLDFCGVENLNDVIGYKWVTIIDENSRDKILEGWNLFISQKIENFWGYVKYKNIKTQEKFIKKVLCNRLSTTGNYSIVLMDVNFEQPKNFIKADYFVKEIEDEVEFNQLSNRPIIDLFKTNYNNISSSVLWKFQIRRALLEIVEKNIGAIAKHNDHGVSTVSFTQEYLSRYNLLKKDLQDLWKLIGGKLNDLEMLEEIEKLFGDQILNDVCLPCRTLQGACLLAALAVAQDKESINIDLS